MFHPLNLPLVQALVFNQHRERIERLDLLMLE
jgi:hypothetical protein